MSMAVLALGIVLLLVGVAGIHYGRGKRWRPATFFVSLLAVWIGVIALYFVYLVTFTDYGR